MKVLIVVADPENPTEEEQRLADWWSAKGTEVEFTSRGPDDGYEIREAPLPDGLERFSGGAEQAYDHTEHVHVALRPKGTP